MSDTSLMEASLELAEITGANAMRYFRTAIDAETKKDGSPGNDCRSIVGKYSPANGSKHGFLPTESSAQEFGTVETDARRQWIIDPIDGTKSFVRGVGFGKLIAVVEGKIVLAGAASFPALGDTLAAAPGGLLVERKPVFRFDRAESRGRDSARDRHCVQRSSGEAARMARARGCSGAEPHLGRLCWVPPCGVRKSRGDGRPSRFRMARCRIDACDHRGRRSLPADWDGNATAFGQSAIATNADSC